MTDPIKPINRIESFIGKKPPSTNSTRKQRKWRRAEIFRWPPHGSSPAEASLDKILSLPKTVPSKRMMQIIEKELQELPKKYSEGKYPPKDALHVAELYLLLVDYLKSKDGSKHGKKTRRLPQTST